MEKKGAMLMQEKEYIVVVQCHIAMERCSGYFCEKAFNGRIGGFEEYPKEKPYRTLYLTCGGCCGMAVHRKLHDLMKMAKNQEKIEKDRIIVHLATCITKDSYHGPQCPHLDYIKTIIQDKLGLDLLEDTTISKKAEARRKEGKYKA
jgi:predicted metal-binding protein